MVARNKQRSSRKILEIKQTDVKPIKTGKRERRRCGGNEEAKKRVSWIYKGMLLLLHGIDF